MKEEWKVFPRFPDYEISNLGNRRVKDGVDKKLYDYTKRNGKYVWLFTKDEKVKSAENRQALPPHQVVSEVFLPKIKGLDDVRHIDKKFIEELDTKFNEKPKLSFNKIAKYFNVSKTLICNIRNRKSYSELTQYLH